METCKYIKKYYDHDKKQVCVFTCNESPLTTGLCIYHQNENYDENTLEKLQNKIKEINGKKEPLFLIGYNVPEINLKGNFSKPVYLNHAIIGRGDFSDSKFQIIDFSGAKIKSGNFSRTCFEEANFLAIKVEEDINFSQTSFTKKGNFSESILNNSDFSQSVLVNVHFLGTEFDNVDFTVSKMQKCDFFKNKFKGTTKFIGAEITSSKFQSSEFNEVNFIGAQIKGVNFNQCNFKIADFNQALLNIVIFRIPIFQGNVNFSLAQLEKVDFFSARFKKGCLFAKASLNIINFFKNKFQNITSFVEATLKEVAFKNSEMEEADFTDAIFKDEVYFHDILFQNQEKTKFYVEDLSKASFKNSDVTKIKFGSNVKWGGEDGFTLLDEINLPESPQEYQVIDVLAEYRNLKKNYEFRFRFEEANRFLKNEIKFKQKYFAGDIKDEKLVT